MNPLQDTPKDEGIKKKKSKANIKYTNDESISLYYFR